MTEVKVNEEERLQAEVKNYKEEIENYERQIADIQEIIQLNKDRKELYQQLNDVIQKHPEYIKPDRAFQERREYLDLMNKQQDIHTRTECRKLDQEIERLTRQKLGSEEQMQINKDGLAEAEAKLRGESQ